jgi:geranylgeranyl pyrophosphate synthase
MTKENLEQLKNAHDYFATAVQVLSTRCQFFHEEFQGIANTVQFLSHLRDDAKKKIEEIEPPKAEAKKNFEMDLTHVKPEVETVVS